MVGGAALKQTVAVPAKLAVGAVFTTTETEPVIDPPKQTWALPSCTPTRFTQMFLLW